MLDHTIMQRSSPRAKLPRKTMALLAGHRMSHEFVIGRGRVRSFVAALFRDGLSISHFRSTHIPVSSRSFLLNFFDTRVESLVPPHRPNGGLVLFQKGGGDGEVRCREDLRGIQRLQFLA